MTIHFNFSVESPSKTISAVNLRIHRKGNKGKYAEQWKEMLKKLVKRGHKENKNTKVGEGKIKDRKIDIAQETCKKENKNLEREGK